MKPLIIFTKIYLLLSIVKIFIMVSIFLQIKTKSAYCLFTGCRNSSKSFPKYPEYQEQPRYLLLNLHLSLWYLCSSYSLIKETNATHKAKSLLKKTLRYLLDNCYIKLGNKIFRQVIGIPMESDRAVFMANLFIYYFQYNQVPKIISRLKQS